MYPEVPKYTKCKFSNVEELYEIFEEPLNKIGLTKDNCINKR